MRAVEQRDLARPSVRVRRTWERRQAAIAVLAVAMIAAHLLLRYGFDLPGRIANWPLWAALVLGGVPLVAELLINLLRREFGSDLLAGISIVTAVLLDEYLAGTLVVLMLSGGEALESYAVAQASSVLKALARRMPSVAHRRTTGPDGVAHLEDVPLDAIEVGDLLEIFPHETCPADGIVITGHGVMDESYLTGEPYLISKTPGSEVLSGAINGDSALTIRAERKAIDSRYAKIMQVMRESEQRRPRMRRLGDQLGAIYTPVALVIAVGAWLASGEAVRFLAVLVVATPCPLLIAIPVAIIGTISLAARRGIVIRDPVVLEKLPGCRTMIFDKTGTLTYGRPHLTEELLAGPQPPDEVLGLVASVERYSKHPLAAAVLDAARERRLPLQPASQIAEPPGTGLRGVVEGRTVQVTSRKLLARSQPEVVEQLPPQAGGLECVILIDGQYVATYRFRDEPRADGARFIHHLGPKHQFDRVMLVSGDRESEVAYLAEKVGIENVYASQSPEQKVEVVRKETQRADTVFVGDGINDAPALVNATVGLAFGQHSDVTMEAAGAVIMDSRLVKVDELLHLSQRMRRIALQSAIGGMALSVIGMGAAALGLLPPVAGALVQEGIDVVAVANALRAAWPPSSLSHFD